MAYTCGKKVEVGSKEDTIRGFVLRIFEKRLICSGGFSSVFVVVGRCCSWWSLLFGSGRCFLS